MFWNGYVFLSIKNVIYEYKISYYLGQIISPEEKISKYWCMNDKLSFNVDDVERYYTDFTFCRTLVIW